MELIEINSEIGSPGIATQVNPINYFSVILVFICMLNFVIGGIK